MKYCVDVPNFGFWSDPRRFADFAHDVEQAGWDAISVWDHLLVSDGLEVADPWVMLAAAAMTTDRIRLMSLVTPIPRRHPWKLAREAVTIDVLSGGRFTLGVGLGWPTDPEFSRFGGEEDLRTRADMLDEGLEIITGLWSGEPFEFLGDHYQLSEVTFLPRPVQRPRIPIWVGAFWPNRRPVRRAARWDGIAPLVFDAATKTMSTITPDDVAEISDYVRMHRKPDEPFDFSVSGPVPDGENSVKWLSNMEDAGATWWREIWAPWFTISADQWIKKILQGPPTHNG